MFRQNLQDLAATRALKDEIPTIYMPPVHRRPTSKQLNNMLKSVATSWGLLDTIILQHSLFQLDLELWGIISI